MKKVVLIVTGSIAAPKALDLYRLLKTEYDVTVIATPSAHKFVHFPEDMKVYDQFLEQDFYTKNDPSTHINLSLNDGLVIVYPATMNFISKAALAICDNLALATFLASDTNKIIFPAMNHNMYHNQALQNNLELLAADADVRISDTNRGMLACKIIGDGRVKEANEAFSIIQEYEKESNALENKTVLINFGATRTYLDDFRYLTTNSSGKMGQALVKAFLAKNAKVIAVVGDINITLITDKNLTIVEANTNQIMLEKMQQYFSQADIVISAAALSDYQFQSPWKGKINKRQQPNLQVNLVTNIDVLATLGKEKTKQLLIGFSAQDNNDSTIAKNKMTSKNCDGMIMNNIAVMNQTDTEVEFYFKEQNYQFTGSKLKVAQAIVSIISNDLLKLGK